MSLNYTEKYAFRAQYDNIDTPTGLSILPARYDEFLARQSPREKELMHADLRTTHLPKSLRDNINQLTPAQRNSYALAAFAKAASTIRHNAYQHVEDDDISPQELAKIATEISP